MELATLTLYWRHVGCGDAEAACRLVADKWADEGATIVVPWGELGVTALAKGQILTAPAHAPPKVTVPLPRR